jgi:hypothetical protein
MRFGARAIKEKLMNTDNKRRGITRSLVESINLMEAEEGTQINESVKSDLLRAKKQWTDMSKTITKLVNSVGYDTQGKASLQSEVFNALGELGKAITEYEKYI